MVPTRLSTMMKSKKIAVSTVAAILMILLYILIFSFSEQNGEQSSDVSLKVSLKCVEIAETVSHSNWTQTFKQKLAVYFEHPIRKLAHFCEYACLGVLVYLMWVPWMRQRRHLILLTILWVFLSAAMDEIHQLYVPDRSGAFADVLLDTCGGTFGMLMTIWLGWFVTRLIAWRKSYKVHRNQSCTE